METFKPFQCGEILRLRDHYREAFRVWKITGVHYGGLGNEDLVTLIPLDIYNGTAHGKIITECHVPIAFLKKIPHLGRL